MFTCEFLRFLQANRGTPLGPGRESAPARRHASPTHRRRAPPYHSRSSEFGRELGVRQHRTHLQAASRPENPRATRRTHARRDAVDPTAAPACRGPPYRALTRRSLRREANMPRCACIGYKSPPLWLLPEHTAVRRPPLAPPPWARASASFHRRPTIPTSSLGPVAPPQVTHCHPCALPSPELEPPRPPPPAIAVRPHRRLLRPNYGHHPILGEHVVDPDPSPGQERRRTHRIPANRTAPTAKGGIARGWVFLGGFVQSRGESVRQ
jgi:hypothetical protein